MKNYEEVIRDVFERGDEYLMKRKKRIAALKASSAGAGVLCGAAVCFALLSFNAEKPQVADTPAAGIEFSGESLIAAETSAAVTTTANADEEQLVIPTKEQLYSRCTNSLEYIGRLSGSVRTLYGTNSDTAPYIFEGEVQLDYINDVYHARVNAINASDGIITQTNEYFIDSENDIALYDYSGENEDIYNDIYTILPNSWAEHREDPAHEIAVFYYPREMTVGFLENYDNWEITEVRDIDGRSCAIIHGTAEPEYGSRLGVETFEIVADCETGVWMQYEGYDADGTVQAYVYTENVRFGDGAENAPVFMPEYANGFVLDETTVPNGALSEAVTGTTAAAAEKAAETTTAVITTTAVSVTTAATDTAADEAFITSGSCGENVWFEYDENTRTLHFSGSGSDVDVSAALPLAGKFDTVIIDQGITSFKAVPENHLFGMSGSLTIYCSSDFNTIRLQRLLGEYLTFVILDE